MDKHIEYEPEDAGLIQSKPPTEEELREISCFITQSKQRHADQLDGLPLPTERQQSREKES
ncbi:hypothetical protein HNQ93_004218 [Hymenobacter luteus]|uniref:Uncharacterized protein n=2 Tax=Hymenobacter TaxID=89966 RepID=A0A7W9T6J4_9BACT|nr:hypothetical protein [Hymenobacter latericoloratus]MBB6061339.1 hypothetical protein [Hymenobacter luteus]